MCGHNCKCEGNGRRQACGQRPKHTVIPDSDAERVARRLEWQTTGVWVPEDRVGPVLGSWESVEAKDN